MHDFKNSQWHSKSELEIRKPIGKTIGLLESTLRNCLHQHWNEYLFYRKTFLRKGSAKSVHRMRTSIRKLSSLLTVFDLLSVLKDEKLFFDLIDRELKCTSELRDIQVQRHMIAARAPTVLKLKTFSRHLNSSEKICTKAASCKLRHWKTKKQEKCLRALDGGLTAHFAGAPQKLLEKDLFTLKEYLEKDIRKLRGKKLHLKAGNDKDFHKFRICMKDLAHKFETVKPLFVISKDIQEKIRLQKNKLGHLQDKVALRRAAKDFLRKTPSHIHPSRELRREIKKKQSEIIGDNF